MTTLHTPNFEILASAPRTGSPTVPTFTVPRLGEFSAGGLIVVIDCTVDPANASVVFDIIGVDEVSGKTFILLTSAAIVATGTTILRVSPHLTAAANVIAKDIVPPSLSVIATHADTDSITYSVGGMLTG